jgi:hypothetical protein
VYVQISFREYPLPFLAGITVILTEVRHVFFQFLLANVEILPQISHYSFLGNPYLPSKHAHIPITFIGHHHVLISTQDSCSSGPMFDVDIVRNFLIFSLSPPPPDTAKQANAKLKICYDILFSVYHQLSPSRPIN